MSEAEQVKKLIFEENEKVLCYHGPLIYEAKVSAQGRNGPLLFLAYMVFFLL